MSFGQSEGLGFGSPMDCFFLFFIVLFFLALSWIFPKSFWDFFIVPPPKAWGQDYFQSEGDFSPLFRPLTGYGFSMDLSKSILTFVGKKGKIKVIVFF